MANVVSGNTVSSSAQFNAGVVDANAIATDAVDSAEIKASAVNTSEIADGAILNEDINASASIVDTKLAQITTAGKVHGTSITGLASLPAGAGVIPSANLPAVGLQLLKANSGTSTNTANNNLDSYAITGLNALDSLLIVYESSAITQAGGIMSIRNDTDSVDLAIPNLNAAIGVGKTIAGMLILKQQQHSNVNILSFLLETGSNTVATATLANNTGNTRIQSAPVTTAWTGSWTLALRNSGLTSGSTQRWSWSVYKMVGV